MTKERFRVYLKAGAYLDIESDFDKSTPTDALLSAARAAIGVVTGDLISCRYRALDEAREEHGDGIAHLSAVIDHIRILPSDHPTADSSWHNARHFQTQSELSDVLSPAIKAERIHDTLE